MDRALKRRVVDPKTGCWIWPGSNTRGRATVKRNGKVIYLARLSYEYYVGPIPPGLDVLHDCDDGLCWNPAHLHPGTAKQNAADMIARGRQPKGKIGRLTQQQVLAIRSDARSGAAIGQDYGISRNHALRIKRRAAYKGVEL